MAKVTAPVAGVDIGTTKITVVIGELADDGAVRMAGIGAADCKGMRKGVLVNLESSCKALQAAVEEAETMAGMEIGTAWISIAGSHVRSFNSRGGINVSGRDGEVTEDDIQRVLDAAQTITIPQDREIFHILPQEYTLDGQRGIKHPKGMAGSRLLANVHVVTGSTSTIQNIVACVNRCGIEVADVVLGQIASAESVLLPDERELGALLIDIGGGTTDVGVFEKDTVWHTSVLPAGGDNFTNDIAVGLRTPIPDAERIKLRYGCASSEMVGTDESLEVPSVGGRKGRVLSRKVLCEILEPRAEEIFTLVAEDVKNSGYDQVLRSGAVLTGGGSLLDGIVEVAEKCLDMPVRRGVPERVEGVVEAAGNPTFSTASGLLRWAAGAGSGRRRTGNAARLFHDVGRKVRHWLGTYF